MTLTAPPEAAQAAPSRWQRIRPPVVVAAVVLVLSVALHFRDPNKAGSWGFCPWLVMTGTYCPGCGGLRAVNALTRGDVVSAASSNLLFVSSIPLLTWMWARSLSQRWRGAQRSLPRPFVAAASAVGVLLIFAFWLLRNLSFASWLTP